MRAAKIIGTVSIALLVIHCGSANARTVRPKQAPQVPRELKDTAKADFASLSDYQILLLASDCTGNDDGSKYAATYGEAALPRILTILQRDDLSATQITSLAFWVGGYKSTDAVSGIIKKFEALKLPAVLSNEERWVIDSLIVGLGTTAQPEGIKLLDKLVTREYWLKREPQHQVPSLELDSEKTIELWRHCVLAAYALSGTDEAFSRLTTGKDIPKDLSHALPSYARMCSQVRGTIPNDL
ncbi:MAG: hypothetical protein HZB26_11015 [Candidatus Hydrogenedentes bacterium]|nr:hypothetical protein [Candidatus Hydrogenedentota bacterium]